jgi:hypothetical protein
MVVFLWPGGGGHGKRRPPEPIPASLRHCVTEGWGDYCANCCPRCSAVQGDYYLPRDNPDYARVRELTRNEYGGPSASALGSWRAPFATTFSTPRRTPRVSPDPLNSPLAEAPTSDDRFVAA